jgi:hypothetical protein
MTDDPNDLGVTRGFEAIDRLTRLCVEMTEPLDKPENWDVKAVVLLHDEDRGGIQIHGYDDEAEAMADLFIHMKAIFQAQGKDLQFIGIPESPEGLDDPT